MQKLMADCVDKTRKSLRYPQSKVNLPPCVSIISNVDRIYQDYENLKPKLNRWNKAIDTKTINEDWTIFVSIFSVEEETIIDCVNLLDHAGYSGFLKNANMDHSSKVLSAYYSDHPVSIYWYCVPAGCEIWNEMFGLELARLVAPNQEWKTKLILSNDGESHITVTDGLHYFDLLDWYEGGVILSPPAR